MTFAYLDYNATSKPREAAVAAAQAMIAQGGNPSSIHGSGRAARMQLERARAEIAALANARPEDVILTSGATEANALALCQPDVERVIVSSVEHPSVLEAQVDAERLPVDASGIVDLDALRTALSDGEQCKTLIAVMAVNNETGVIQPIQDIAAIVTAAGARLHVDAVQAAGRIALGITKYGRATLALSAHKIGGPTGCGALLHVPSLQIHPIIKGGGQERRRRAGTENLAGVVGFGAAAREVLEQAETEASRISDLRDRLESALGERAPNALVIARNAPRVSNTMCVALPGTPAEKQVISLDLAGVQVSAGSACSSGKVTESPVLAAMGFDTDIAGSAIRVSLGWATSEDDIKRFLDAYGRLAAKAADA